MILSFLLCHPKGVVGPWSQKCLSGGPGSPWTSLSQDHQSWSPGAAVTGLFFSVNLVSVCPYSRKSPCSLVGARCLTLFTLFLKFLDIVIYEVFFAGMHITSMPQALVGKKGGSDLLELELEMLVIMM